MRPTRSGVVAVVAVPVLAVLAWLFGQPEAAAAAAALAAVVVASASAVVANHPRVQLDRTLRPARVAVGDPCTVRLAVRNLGRRRTPVIGIRDDAGVYGVARMQAAPIRPGAACEASYPFPSHRRGLHPIGPLTVEVEDPFGLFRRSERIGDVGTLIVVPATHALAPLPEVVDDEPEHGSRVLAVGATVDEEFAAMRPYAVGDDIRRIHWRTTARVGHPVVRQYDQPWQRRTTVMLDLDADAADTAAFERAVVVTASVVRLAGSEGGIVRLLTTDGVDSGEVSAVDHLDALLDRLAAVRPDPATSIDRTLRLLGPSPPGRLVVVSATSVPTWASASRSGGSRLVVSTATWPVPATGPDSDPLVCWDGSRDLATVWAEATRPGLSDPRPVPQR